MSPRPDQALGAGGQITRAVGESIAAGDALLNAQRDLAKRTRNIVVRSGHTVGNDASISERPPGRCFRRKAAKLVTHAREVAACKWLRCPSVDVVDDTNGQCLQAGGTHEGMRVLLVLTDSLELGGASGDGRDVRRNEWENVNHVASKREERARRVRKDSDNTLLGRADS